MKTKKALLPILASALLLTIGLAACTNNNASGASQSGEPSEPAEEKIVITSAGDKKEIQVGETLQLTASVDGVEWSTKSTDIVSVSNTGLVTALKEGSARITAKKDGYTNGSFTVTVTKAPDREAKYSLRLEEAEHYDPDDFWGMSYGGTLMGPGDSPVEDNSGATDDGTSLGWLQEGCKETMRFTVNKAAKVEMGVTMAYNAEMALSGVLSVKFNGKEISMEGKTVPGPETEGSYYEFHTVSFGQVDLIAGENVLVIEMLGQGPNMDKVVFFTEETLTITSIPAQVKEKIEVVESALEVLVGETVQIQVKNNLAGVAYTSSDATIASVNNSGVVTGVAKGKATVTVSKEGYKDAKVEITVKNKPAANEVVLEAEDGILPEGTSIQIETNAESSGGKSIGYFSAEQTFEIKYTAPAAVEADLVLVAAPTQLKADYSGIAEMNLAETMELKLNNNPISLAGKVLPEVSGWNFQSWNDVELGKVNLVAGENTFSFKALAQGPNIDCLKLVLPGTTATVTPVADNTASEQGVTYLEFETAEFTRPEGANESQNLVVEDSATAHGGKSLGYVNAGNKVTLKFNASAAGKVNLRFTAASTKGTFDFATFSMSIGEHVLEDCITIKLNDKDLDLTDIVLPGNAEGSYQNWQDIDFGNVDVEEGLNTIVLDITAQGPNFDCVKVKGTGSVVITLPSA